MKLDSQTKSEIFLDKKSNPLFLMRKSLRLSQQEMAEKLGITKNYVWMMESGEKPITADLIARIGNLTANQDNHTPSNQTPVSDELPHGIMRIADQFERHVLSQLSILHAKLDEVLKRLDALESKKPKG